MKLRYKKNARFRPRASLTSVAGETLASTPKCCQRKRTETNVQETGPRLGFEEQGANTVTSKKPVKRNSFLGRNEGCRIKKSAPPWDSERGQGPA